jgi:hypothetical protein
LERDPLKTKRREIKEMILESILAIGGLVVPPVFDFFKRKFVKEATPQQMLSVLAETQPDAMIGFVEAQTKFMEANVKWFNRDVVGDPSRWVTDLRASIRPIGVVLSIGVLASEHAFPNFALDPYTRSGLIVCVTSWFGDRLTQH